MPQIIRILEKEGLEPELILENVALYLDRDGSVLTKFSPQDLADYINEFVDEQAYITVQSKVDSKQELEWMYNKLQRLREGRAFMLIAIDYTTDRLAGILELIPFSFPFQHSCEFSISVRASYRGRGLAKEMFRIAIREAKRMGYINLHLYVSAENKAAIKLYKKLGFKTIVKLKKERYHYGRLVDEIMMVYTGKYRM
ncbi:MAG: GNAT family N-acetyltransferase [Candidatus Micrarchaeota archaeon]|nr:GNAT family N-acetyltransferase [Candidatus Micrarchaeota archaeon]MCX8154553.1 GNAT family N-acetyltransferase [Candidatus Micrarchaeota archaeon]